MTLRHRGADLPLEPDGLAQALPDAGPRVAIFVHGLGETDASWRLRADAQRPGYGACLRRDLGHTPIELRYNTGLHISDNGRALAALLEELHEAWPVAIEEIVIVGHSMGGLVARSACHYGSTTATGGRAPCATSSAWARRTSARRWRRASTRSAGRWAGCPRRARWPTLLNVRSAGIKDLRYGSCAEEDWCDCDPDELLTDRCHDVPFLPGARFYFVAATLSRRPGRPAGRDPRRPARARPQRLGRGPQAQDRLRHRGRPPRRRR